MAGPTREFWQGKFESGVTPWDRGVSNPLLGKWIDAGVLAPCRILVPGCGSGYEVAELALRGFEVTGLDYAPAAIERARARIDALPEPARSRAHLVHADALHWLPDEPFEAIYEQTCLCALYPDLWEGYARQLHRWLRPDGALHVLFMQVSRPGAAQGFIEGPPYHCDINAMRALLPASRWQWPRPPFERLEHPMGAAELALVLRPLPEGAAGG